MDTNLSDFQESLTGKLDTLNDRLENFDTPLRDAVDQISKTFDSQLEILNTRLENFDEPLQEAADQMRGTFADLVIFMRNIVGDLQKEIKEQNEKYGEQLTSIKDLNERVKKLLTQLGESSNSQKEAVDTLSTNVVSLTDNINKLDNAIDNFTSDSGELSQSIGAIKGDIEKLGAASQQFVEKVDKADVTPLTNSIERLNTSIDAISQHSQTLANAANKLVQQEGASGSVPKTKRSSFKSKLNPLSWIRTSKQNNSGTQNDNEGK